MKNFIINILEILIRKLNPEPTPEITYLAWGEKVSEPFRNKVFEVANHLQINPNHLMAVMAFETGYTFNPAQKNLAGSGATGLIQFMPATARDLGTSVDVLARMTGEHQLNYVGKYFQPYKGKIKNLSDLYMAVLWPAAIGKPEDYVLWDKSTRPTTYRQNAGLDRNTDGKITKAEAASMVKDAYSRGLQEGNIWRG